MGSGMSNILPGLYLGSIRDSKDKEQLAQNQITHIVSIHDNAKQQDDERSYLCIAASDTPSENLLQHFAAVNDFIHSARLKNGNVLVHCLAGISRSTTLVTAYVMSISELNYRDSLGVVRGSRREACPNFGFIKQLKKFESQNLEEERRRLKLNHGVDKLLLPGDNEMCQKHLAIYQGYLDLGDRFRLEQESLLSEADPSKDLSELRLCVPVNSTSISSTSVSEDGDK